MAVQTVLTLETNGPGLTEFTHEAAAFVRSAGVEIGLLTVFAVAFGAGGALAFGPLIEEST